MSFQERLKEARNKAGLSQKEVGALSGVGASTVSEYETGKKQPTMNAIYRLINVLHTDANFLFQDEVEHHESESNSSEEHLEVSKSEFAIIEKYRSLDDYGKTAVERILEIESDRCVDQAKQQEKFEKFFQNFQETFGPKSKETQKGESQTSKTG